MSYLVSIVIPVYNNSKSLHRLYQELNQVFRRMPDATFEIIWVNDGSSDNSREILETFLKDQESISTKIIVLNLSKNFGQISALMAGYSKATGDCIITISADLQDPTEIIEDFFSNFKAGSDFVFGQRQERQDEFFRILTSRIAYWFLRKDVKLLPKGGFDIFLMDSRIKSDVLNMPGRFNFLQADVLSHASKISSVPYVRSKRIHGKSGYNFQKRLKNFSLAFFDSSYLPIQYLSKVGYLTSLLGFTYLSFMVCNFLISNQKYTLISVLLVVFLLLGGIQLILMGFIGQYIWKIYDLLRKKPSYVIESILNNQEKSD